MPCGWPATGPFVADTYQIVQLRGSSCVKFSQYLVLFQGQALPAEADICYSKDVVRQGMVRLELDSLLV